MTTRERMTAILDGKAPDRIPWIPRIELWYRARQLAGDLPDRWKDFSLRQLEDDLFGATAARGGSIFKIKYDGIDVVRTQEGDTETTEYRTPVGSVRTVQRISDELKRMGLPGRVEEELLKGPSDYRVWEYVVEHTNWDASFDTFLAYDEKIGADGFPMVAIGDVPFHEFVQKLAGYNDAFYQIADYPDEVDHLLRTMQEVQKDRMWPIALESPAKLLLAGVHLSSQFTPPQFFEKYIIPYCRELFPLLHNKGKRVAMHADNDTSQIAKLLEDAGWDMLECFVTAPMVPMTIEKARQVWGTRMILWGGIPSAILAPSYPFESFTTNVKSTFKAIGKGDAVILGVADNVMPDSDITRVKWITDYVDSHGWYPVN
ncbi:MAG: hypothetical protein CMN78_01585 [Spirochaetales bacterium]|nr:hypothetical protein [Spirochaetales bacterium]